MSIKSLFENIADAIKDKNPNVTNVTPDEMPNAIRSIPSGSSSASGVTYDNTTSGLSATNVQDAIDEVVGDVTTINSDLSELNSKIKHKTVTNTTDTYGRFSLGLPYTASILCCKTQNTSAILDPIVMNGSTWFVHALDYSNMANLANQQITVDVTYIE